VVLETLTSHIFGNSRIKHLGTLEEDIPTSVAGLGSVIAVSGHMDYNSILSLGNCNSKGENSLTLLCKCHFETNNGEKLACNFDIRGGYYPVLTLGPYGQNMFFVRFCPEAQIFRNKLLVPDRERKQKDGLPNLSIPQPFLARPRTLGTPPRPPLIRTCLGDLYQGSGSLFNISARQIHSNDMNIFVSSGSYAYSSWGTSTVYSLT
jgi:hypothetical protein